MRALGPRLAAVLTVLISVATAVITNLITSKWSWTLALGLGVLVLLAAGLAASQAAARPSRRLRVTQTASGGAEIRGSAIQAAGDAAVAQAARRHGKIVDSPVTARDADVARRVSRADIVNSPITASGGVAADQGNPAEGNTAGN